MVVLDGGHCQRGAKEVKTPEELLKEVEDRNDLWRADRAPMLAFFERIQKEAQQNAWKIIRDEFVDAFRSGMDAQSAFDVAMESAREKWPFDQPPPPPQPVHNKMKMELFGVVTMVATDGFNHRKQIAWVEFQAGNGKVFRYGNSIPIHMEDFNSVQPGDLLKITAEFSKPQHAGPPQSSPPESAGR